MGEPNGGRRQERHVEKRRRKKTKSPPREDLFSGGPSFWKPKARKRPKRRGKEGG